MFKYIKVIFVATIVCFVISVTAFSFADKSSLKNLSWTYQKSWFNSEDSEYVDFNVSQEIQIEEKDEFEIYMVAGSLKVRPSEDGVGRLKVETKVKSGLNLSINDFFKTVKNKKVLYLAHDEKTLQKAKEAGDNFSGVYSFGEIRKILSDAKYADVILELPVNINSLQVNGVSAEVEVLGQKFKTLEVNNVSGDVELNQVDSAVLSLNSVSGDITCESCMLADKVEVNTVSGDVTFTLADDAKYKINFSSMSGDLNAQGRIDPQSQKHIEVNSVSGDFILR